MADTLPVEDHNCSRWSEARNLFATMLHILAAGNYLVARTDSAVQACMQILAALGNLYQDFDLHIELDNLAEKIAVDNPEVHLCIVAVQARSAVCLL